MQQLVFTVLQVLGGYVCYLISFLVFVQKKKKNIYLFIFHRAPVLVAIALIEMGLGYEDAISQIRSVGKTCRISSVHQN